MSPSASTPFHSRGRPPALRYKVFLIAIILTAAVYAPAVLFDFAYDDFGQIVFNPAIKSWRLALGYFTTHVWAQTGGVALYYRPAFMLWLATNYTLFGLNPSLWHILTIALHVVCCVLLYGIARRLTDDLWVCAVAVCLFGLHPAHVEAVAWVSGATEPLLGAFLLASLLCYMNSTQADKSRRMWLAGSLVLASVAILAKETAMVLPGLVFSYEWTFSQGGKPFRRRLDAAFHAALPYILVVAAYIAIRSIALQQLTPPRTTAALASVVLAWPRILTFYIGHLFFPFRLSAFYTPITLDKPDIPTLVIPLVLISFGALALSFGVRRSRIFGFLLAWGCLMLLPALNVTLVHNFENVHDRYLYLPSAAFCILLAGLLGRLRDIGATRSATAALSIILGGYAFLTVAESRYWANDFRLAERGLSIAPGHAVAAQMLGNAYIRGENMRAAIPHLLTSLDAQPDNSDTLSSLGLCYLNIGSLPSAEEYLDRAIHVNPTGARSHLLLGVVLFSQKRLDEAEAELRRGFSLQRAPDRLQEFHYYLGEVLYAKGDLRAAREEYAIEARNDDPADPRAPLARQRLRSIDAAEH